ncbi:MAG: hypothetical protein PHQ23_12290, partial [Candidatus Wallbacteria bacterium]|nr:hypothetical protein [Candidatus Wallbacteria bacterium]
RYYDPKIGRFLQRDTFNETAMLKGDFGVMHNPLQMNDWVYCGNGPVNYGDPHGKQHVLERIVTLVIGGVLIAVASWEMYQIYYERTWDADICRAGFTAADDYDKWRRERSCSSGKDTREEALIKEEKINELFEREYSRLSKAGCNLSRDSFSEIFFRKDCWGRLVQLP